MDYSNGENEDLEELSKKHSAEKKEFTKSAMQMKRAVKTSDKKKKKELHQQLDILEKEMIARHKNEMDQLMEQMSKELSELKADDVNDGSEADAGEKSAKVGRAQRRRVRKEIREKEREKCRKEADKEAVNSERVQEERALEQLLKCKHLKLHEVPANGDCLYNAIAHQFALRRIQVTTDELRHTTANIFRQNKKKFMPFIIDPPCDGDGVTEKGFAAYCRKVETKGVWGGHPEIMAIAEAYRVPIEILQAAGPRIVIGEEFLRTAPPVVIVFQRYALNSGSHYDSTSPVNAKDEWRMAVGASVSPSTL